MLDEGSLQQLGDDWRRSYFRLDFVKRFACSKRSKWSYHVTTTVPLRAVADLAYFVISSSVLAQEFSK